MRKVYKFLIVAIIALILIPFEVRGETFVYSSKETGDIEDFSIDKLSFKTVQWAEYYNFKGSGKPGVSFDVFIINEYNRNVDFTVTLDIYGKNGKKLDTYEKEMSLISLTSAHYSEDIYSTDKYSVKDVDYYTLTLDVATNISVIKDSNNYYIDNYYMYIKVLENNVYEVNNTFRATFKNGRTSPVKYGIPLRSKFVRFDGGRLNKRAVVSDIKVPDYTVVSTQKGVREIEIGKDNLVYESKHYDISYTYNAGKDIRDGNDEFAFYIVNNNPVKMDGLKFEIEMPSNINYEDIHFIDQDGIELENVKCEVKDNIIVGEITGTIEPETMYAIYVLLPDGYFKDTISTINNYTIMSAILPICFLFITILLWYLYKKSNEKGEFNSFYFNKNINSLEIGYLYSGKVKDNDIATLLFYLANQGYIRIEKNGRSYKIIKVKDYEDNDRVEKALMKELFYDQDEIDRKDLSVVLNDMNKIMNQKLSEDKRRKKIYLLPVLNYKLLFYIMVALILVINTINVIINYQPSVILINIISSGIGYIILFSSMRSNRNKIEKIIFFLISFIFIVTPIVLSSYQAFLEDSINLFIYIISIICMVLIVIIVGMMSNRTRYGRTMYKKINGYKRYLINVTEEDIDKELESNKNLFYDVLPYTFVLGISDKWFDKFKYYRLKEPTWYKCDKFDLKGFNKDIKNIYSDLFIALKSNNKK